jgi:hypothetical protein
MDKPRLQRVTVQFTRVTTEKFARTSVALGAYQDDIRKILTSNAPPRCPHCNCWFGEKTCPHWVWTFTGPVFMERPIEYVTIPIKVTNGDAPSEDPNH